MRRKKQIDEWALDYWLLQRYAKLAFRIYFRKIEVRGLENIPANVPVILAPNHQNALIDAMVLVCRTNLQNVFLARADIFKGKLMIRFLTYLNIMPIYRLRDGIENVKRNDEVFSKTLQVMRNRLNPLVLFPEGNHGDKRRLRPLVKGLFRIAFMAQEDYGDKPGVTIVPVGIDYSHYHHFGGTLLVNFGRPLQVSDNYRLYAENPVGGLNKIKEDFAAALSTLMIDIQPLEHYDTYMRLRKICNSMMRVKMGLGGRSLQSRFRADKEMIRCLDRELEKSPLTLTTLGTETSDYESLLNKRQLRDWVLERERYPLPGLAVRMLVSLVLIPVFVFGFVNNCLPYWFTGSRVRNLKDPQFQSSFKYVIGMIAFPLWYLIVTLVLVIFTGWPAWLILLYLVLMPVTGLFSFHFYISVKKLVAMIRYTWFVHTKDPVIARLRNLRKTIREQVSAIVDKNS